MATPANTTTEAAPEAVEVPEPDDVPMPNLRISPEAEAAAAASQTGRQLTDEQIQRATDWFLSDEPEPPTVLEFDVNVAATGLPAKYIRWAVRPLTRREIRDIRRDCTNPQTGEVDDMEVNMRVLIRASVDPNFEDPQVRGQYADPADLVNQRFGHKPGIIEAVARKANEMSGYGTAEIIRPVDAAGN